MIRVIRVVKPRLFLFENVKGLLVGRWRPDGVKGEIWHDVLKAFRRIKGYHVRWRLVQAKDYGVPQNRPRVLLVGVRDDLLSTNDLRHEEDAVLAGLLPEPSPALRAPDLRDVFSDLLDPQYQPGFAKSETYAHEARGEFQREMRAKTGLQAGATVSQHEYSNHSPHVIEKFTYMLTNDGEIPDHLRTKKFAQRLLKPVWGEEGPNITATSLPDDFVHYAQPRSPTVREWARLQTFPDHYEFYGPRTTGGTRRAGVPTEGIFDREVPRYTQIGNAVPVRLARAVGAHFARLLDEGTSGSPSSQSQECALIGK